MTKILKNKFNRTKEIEVIFQRDLSHLEGYCCSATPVNIYNIDTKDLAYRNIKTIVDGVIDKKNNKLYQKHHLIEINDLINHYEITSEIIKLKKELSYDSQY